MKFRTDDDKHSFVITQSNGLIGIYDNDDKQQSTLEFTNTLPTSDGEFSKVPSGWIAQDGYMTTNPKQQGLGYMMSFAGATMAAQGGIENVFVSSGSVGGGGQAVIAALGGAKYDLSVTMQDGKTEIFGGYAIPVASMLEKSTAGWKAKGWVITDDTL